MPGCVSRRGNAVLAAQSAGPQIIFFAAYDRYLDQASSDRWLEHPAVAEIIVENLYHHHQVQYHLLEYSVMPNHVHVLFIPMIADAASVGLAPRPAENREVDYFSGETADNESPLTRIMHSLKSYTANEANRLLNRTGRFWQRESYDHWVRDDAELRRIVEYIAQNAVNAGLAINPWDSPYCSAHDRRQPRNKLLTEWC